MGNKAKHLRIWIAIAVLFFVILFCAGLAAWSWDEAFGSGPLENNTVVLLPAHHTGKEIANELANAGAIASPLLFVALSHFLEPPYLKAGEYEIPAHASMASIIGLLQSGQTIVHKVTIPEGLTSAEIVDILRKEPSLSGYIETIPPEGSLMPETYYFTRDSTRSGIIFRMQNAMQKTLTEAWAHRAEGLPISNMEQAMILASIVEKETGIADERAVVAGVFVNRLKIGMRLQSDPTVIYALTKGKGPLDRPLTRTDWHYQSPYNTYENAGLPPMPISNPGKASLEATLHPAKHKFLYFVAGGDGRHVFADNLNAHNANVSKQHGND